MQLFTKTLNDAITIGQNDGVFRATIKANGGEVLVTGTVVMFQEIEGGSVILKDGETLTLEAFPQAPIFVTITPDVSVDVIFAFN